MPQIIKQFNFNGGLEGWIPTPAGSGVSGSQSASDGSLSDTLGTGCLQLRNGVQNNNRAGNYWEWVGTWQDLGIPEHALVQAVNVSYDWRCAEWASGTGNNNTGPCELRSSTGSIRHTFSPKQANVTGVTSWATLIGTALTSLLDPANTAIRLRLGCDLRTANSAGAAVTIRHDWIVVTITYEIPTYPASFTVQTNREVEKESPESLIAAYSGQGIRILFTETTLDAQSNRRLQVMVGANGQDHRRVTRLAAVASQTRRAVSVVAAQSTQAMRRVRQMAYTAAQTSRKLILQAIAEYAGQSFRQVRRSTSSAWQFRRRSTIPAGSQAQPVRGVRAQTATIGQTSRHITLQALAEFIGQTSRRISLPAAAIWQTARRLTVFINTAGQTRRVAQMVRKISNLVRKGPWFTYVELSDTFTASELPDHFTWRESCSMGKKFRVGERRPVGIAVAAGGKDFIIQNATYKYIHNNGEELDSGAALVDGNNVFVYLTFDRPGNYQKMLFSYDGVILKDGQPDPEYEVEKIKAVISIEVLKKDYKEAS